MSHVLDTNVCIALINGRPPLVRHRLRQALDGGAALAVSTITLFELWYGVAKSVQVQSNTERLAAFLAPSDTLPFDDADAEAAGKVRAALERAGTPIGAYDCLIAGQALRRGLVLVTANMREFGRIAGLRWVNWAR